MTSSLPEHFWVPQERGRLMQFVAGKVRDETVCEDVVQETLIRVNGGVKVGHVAAQK